MGNCDGNTASSSTLTQLRMNVGQHKGGRGGFWVNMSKNKVKIFLSVSCFNSRVAFGPHAILVLYFCLWLACSYLFISYIHIAVIMPFVRSKALCWKHTLKIKSDSQKAACAENTEKTKAWGLINMTHLQ